MATAVRAGRSEPEERGARHFPFLAATRREAAAFGSSARGAEQSGRTAVGSADGTSGPPPAAPVWRNLRVAPAPLKLRAASVWKWRAAPILQSLRPPLASLDLPGSGLRCWICGAPPVWKLAGWAHFCRVYGLRPRRWICRLFPLCPPALLDLQAPPEHIPIDLQGSARVATNAGCAGLVGYAGGAEGRVYAGCAVWLEYAGCAVWFGYAGCAGGAANAGCSSTMSSASETSGRSK